MYAAREEEEKKETVECAGDHEKKETVEGVGDHGRWCSCGQGEKSSSCGRDSVNTTVCNSFLEMGAELVEEQGDPRCLWLIKRRW